MVAPACFLLLLIAGTTSCRAACTEDCLVQARLAVDGAELKGRLTKFYYFENQPANFSCRREPSSGDSNATIQLSYFSQETKTVTTSYKDLDVLEIYMRLSHAHNDTLLTCSARQNSTVFTIQVRLLQRPDKYQQGFVVSGLQLPAVESVRVDGDRQLRYQYRYLQDEHFSVHLVWNVHRYAAVRCDIAGDHFPGTWQDHVAAADAHVGVNLTDVSLMPEQTDTELRCRLRRLDPLDPFAPDLYLTLTFTFYQILPEVGGMTMWAVELLYFYRSEGNITTVYYDNAGSANGTHYLSCMPDPVSWWVWNPGEVDKNPDRNIGDNDYPRAFRLYEHADWTLLKCVQQASGDRPERITQVWLHRHRPQPIPVVTTGTSNLPSPTAPSEFNSTFSWWWAATAMLVAVAVVAVVIGVKIQRRYAIANTRKTPAAHETEEENVYEEIRESRALPATDDANLFYETPYMWSYVNRPVYNKSN